MKAAVISGGGSWGAFTVGYLKETRPEYDLVVGTSTGALMAPFVALQKYNALEKAYTNQTNKDIWNFRPVQRSGKLRTLAILRFAFLSRTFGKSENLLKTIRRIYTPALHAKLQISGKRVYVCVYNLDIHKEEYRNISFVNWWDATEWMYISACAPMVMSLPEKDGNYYTDGGLSSILPLLFTVGLLDSERNSIDAFIHRTKESVQGERRNRVVNNLDNLMDTFKALELNTLRQNIEVGVTAATVSWNKVNEIYMPSTPDFSPMWFDPKDMKGLVEEGIKIAKDEIRSV